MSANRSNLLSAMTASHGSPPQINPHNEDRWPWSAAGHAGSRAKPADGAVCRGQPKATHSTWSSGPRCHRDGDLSAQPAPPPSPQGALSLLDKPGESDEQAVPGMHPGPKPSPGPMDSGQGFYLANSSLGRCPRRGSPLREGNRWRWRWVGAEGRG